MSRTNSITTAQPSGNWSETLNSTNPFVFLVGCPRSGTTMLKRMVNAHPLVAVTRETHWIPGNFEKRKGVTDDGLVTDRIVDKFFEHQRFDQMKMRRERLEAMVEQNPGMTYASLVSRLFDHYGKRKKKPLVGDKTPTCVRKMPTLHQLWPQAKFVHLVRDGRDVCLSMRNWRMVHKTAGQFSTWQIDPVVTTALWWKALVGLGMQDGVAMGENRYLDLRYEQLVLSPGRECRKIASFLELPYSESMESYYEGRTRTNGDLSTNAAWLPPTPGRRNWRDQMTAEQVERFEAAAGNLLDMLGYERACPNVSRLVAHNVGLLKQQFTEEIQAKNWRLPDLW
jgi:hypothetical protein